MSADRAAGVAAGNYPPGVVGTFGAAEGTGTNGESFLGGSAPEKQQGGVEVAAGGAFRRVRSRGVCGRVRRGARVAGKMHANPDDTWPRLAIGKGQHAVLDLGPSEAHDLTLAATGEKQKADNVGLLPCALSALPIQGGMEAYEFLPRQKSRETGPPVECSPVGWIALDMAAGDGEVQDLPKTAQRMMVIARRGPAVSLEPSPDRRLPNPVQGLRSESR